MTDNAPLTAAEEARLSAAFPPRHIADCVECAKPLTAAGRTLLRAAQDITSFDRPTVYISPEFLAERILDIEKQAREAGAAADWEPQVGLRDGLARTIAWAREELKR